MKKGKMACWPSFLIVIHRHFSAGLKIIKYKLFEKKKLVSIIMIFVMVVSSFITSPVMQLKAIEEKEVYKDDICKVKFKVNSQWENGFEGQIIIENIGQESIENWKFNIKFPHEITSIWDAKIMEHKGNVYKIQYPDWNIKIPPAGKVVIGFNAKKDKIITAPSEFHLQNDRSAANEEDFEITYKTTSDWKDAFNGQISIKNNTKANIEGWELEFEFDKEIKDFWTAKIKSREGKHYTIRNDEWNSVIKPGETINLGFEGKPGNVKEVPKNFKITKVKDDSQNENDEEEYDPSMDFDLSKVDMNQDADADGMPDEIEKLYETDVNKADTDDDGIPDGYEVEELDTDPVKSDTDQNGVTDDEEDIDKDDATNLQEFVYKTDPNDFDTDGDGLSDGEEINRYKTDPLVKDIDKDGLSDSDEIILKLDPFKTETFDGIKDSDYQVDQKLTENMIDFNKESNKYKVSIDIKASGCIQNHLNIFSPTAQFVATDNRAVLGDLIHIRYMGGTVSAADIKFRIAEKEIKAANSDTPDIDKELKGLKRYQIFHLIDEDADENAGLLLPVETRYDFNTNTISATVDELGEYCILDMNMWLYDLGLRYDSKYTEENDTKLMSKQDMNNINDKPSQDYSPVTLQELKKEINQIKNYGEKPVKKNLKTNRQVDLTVVIDASHSMETAMNKMKADIGSLVSRLYEHGITLHVSLVKFTEYKEGKEDNTKVLKTQKGSTWATSAEEAIELINKLEVASGKAKTPLDGLGMGRKLDYRDNADKYMVLLTDENCNPTNRYGIKSINEMADLLRTDKIITCVVTKNSLEEVYAPLATKTGGSSFDINTNFATGIEQLILAHAAG